jgi:hypothetical protein
VKRAVPLLLATGLVLIDAQAAGASIALVQKGVEAGGGGTSVTATLPASTTAGDLLVATVQDLNSNCATDNYTAPAGWVKAAHVCRAGTNPGPLEIWYDANVSAGISSVVFNTGSSGANSLAQLSEWSGAATSSVLDQTGTATNANSTTTPSVTTSGSLAASGELAITSFDTSSGLSSFTPGTGWTSLRSDPGSGLDVDYDIGPASGSALTETITSSPQTTYGAAVATFKSAACSGGSLTVEAPSSVAFPGVTLNAYSQSATVNFTATPDDETGNGSGWNLNATSTTLTTGTRTLPTTATTVTGASSSAATGNCSLPTNSVSYPVTLPAGSTPPTAAELFNGATGTGKGPTNVTFTGKITVPGNARSGSYSSTWTLTMASGP